MSGSTHGLPDQLSNPALCDLGPKQPPAVALASRAETIKVRQA